MIWAGKKVTTGTLANGGTTSAVRLDLTFALILIRRPGIGVLSPRKLEEAL